jgi:CSLREA domain-containing protein
LKQSKLSFRSRIFSTLFTLILVLVLQSSQLSAAPFQVPQQTGQRIWLGQSQPVGLQKTGAFAPAAGLLEGAAPNAVALASGDFDGDGVMDLVVGYSTGASGFLSIQRGNLDAFAPQSAASFQAIGRGQFPTPFNAQPLTFAVPASPDFVATGDFNGDGHLDVAVAAKGGTAIYLLIGDGKGSFAAPQAVPVNGTVVTLAAGNLGRTLTSSMLAGVSSPQTGFSLLVFSLPADGSSQNLSAVASFSLSAAPSNILFGDFGEAGDDAAFLVDGDVALLHSSSMELEQLSLPVSGSAMALGSFIYDRNAHIQIALLGSDGSVEIAAHSEFDPHALSVDEMRANRQAIRNGQPSPVIAQTGPVVNGWKIVETIPAATSFFSASAPPVFFRTRISDHGADDLMVLNGATGQMAVIAHPDPAPDAPTFGPAEISTRPYTGSPVAALAMRTNIDGRPGVVALHSGSMTPMVMMPLPDPTFTVNTTADGVHAGACAAATPGQCTLREAVIEANNTAGTDTIIVPAGTYTLTLPKVANDCTAQHGALYINDSVNISGAGQATTIIQAGTSQATGVDFVMAVNEDLATPNCPVTNATASISNLTLKFGHNNGTHSFDGDGGCMEFDTGSSGNANLTLTNVTLDSCTTTKGEGGGIAIFNASSGPGGNGLATITDSIIQNNSASDTSSTTVAATAGGIWVSVLARMSMTNSQVLNNNATQVSGDNSVAGEGGGITISNNISGSRQTAIHGSTIDGNHAAGNGGGIHNQANLLIDQSSIISNNSAGTANLANAKDGGGLWTNTGTNGCPATCSDVTTLNKVTITGNTTTGNGGGIAIGNNTGSGNVTMIFSRLAGNSAPVGKNLSNNSATISVTDNWWGSNTPTSTISTVGTGVTTFDPFIELTHVASPAIIKINQSSTLTGSLAQDNHGTAIAAGSLTQVIGLPITFNNPVLGTIPQAQPETLNANAQATATFNAGGTSGLGHADATVDQATVTANIVVLEPLKITKSFSPTTVAVNAPSTLTFNVTNPNVIAVDASFTDTLPVGLVVAATPGLTNTCGGTVTATAGAGSVSFSNAALPVGACTITVKVSSAVDSIYNNSVTINSTAAGTGAQSTSSASLTVINPPSITKQFGAATIPLNGTTSLTFTISSTNQNLTLNGVAFTDNLPAGLVVATPSNLNTTCSGTATAAAGASSVSFSGASLAPGASCTVSLNVQGTTAGVKNNSVQVTSTNGGTGNTSNASITVVAPPTIVKAFGAASIPLNGSTSLSFTITNPNATVALTGVAFSDTLPAGLVISTPNGLTGTCGAGTITATAGTGVISLTGGTIAANASCTFSVNVTGITAGLQTNTTGNVTSTEGGTGGTATASINVVAPPSIAKVFNPSTIALNATTSLTFTITNPAANAVALTGVAFTDTLPTGLTVANSTSTVCGGTLTTTAPTGIALSGATIAAGGQCQFSVTVTGAASGQFTNTTGSVTSTNGGTGNTATANLTVVAPPVVAKAFNPTTIPLNGTTTLTITITNPAVNTVALSPVTLNDILPSGLTVASAIVSDPCGLGSGILHTTAPTTIQIGGVTIPANGQCVVNVTVTGATAGQYTNTTGNVSSGNGGTGNSASANLTVVAPATIAKAFGAGSIPLNGTTTVTFTISNPNTAVNGDLTGVVFSDTLPVSGGPGSATLVVAATPGVVNTCGGTVTATAGTGVISLSGGSVAHNSSCTLTVNVTGTAAGDANNITGAISSTQGGTGLASNTASLKVVAPPTISKAFGAAAISLNGTTTVTFTIANPAANTSAENGIAFSDTLTNGLQVASTPGVSNSCGGTVTAAANSTSISLTGGSIATPGATCTIVVNVTGTQSGTVSNTTGAISSTNGGTGATSNTATLIVASPANVTKSFGAARIPLNGTTSLTINISNPNTNVTLNGLAFTDTLPAGLVIAATPNLNNTCGGTATAAAGSSSLSLSGGTLASSASCAVTVNVTGTTAGDKNNSVQVTSTEGGTSATASATVTVAAPPSIAKAFGAASIPLNGTTTVTFTISNPNNPGTPANGDLSGVAFSDTLPLSGGPASATLVVAATPGVVNTCGGTVTATAGTGVISLSGGSVAHNSSCTLTVNVTGTVEGDANNTTGAITSTEGGTGLASNTVTLKVVTPPTISKAFGAANITLNGTTTVTFTITNPAANTSAENGIAFSDTLTNGLQVASTPGVSNSCGGTVTAAANSTSISLTGGSIATPGATCTIVVNVTGTQSGTVTNTTGAISSINGGTGATSNTATLIVASPANVTKSFGAAKIPLNGTTSLTINISNPNTNVSLSGLAFTDTLPAGLVIAATPNLNNTCGGTATAAAGSGSLSLSAGTLASSASCAVTVNVTGTTAGDKNNTVQVTSTEGGTSATASATVTVVAPPSIAKSFGAASIPLNGSTSLSFTIQNNNTTTSLSGIGFSDTLPAGLVISAPNGLTGSCGGGTITATQNTNVISLSGATLAASASCTFSVNVTGRAAGLQNNTSGAVTSTEGGTGATASASMNVVAPPSIAKVFNPSSIALNATTSLTFTITNPAANAVSLTGVAFTDTLPTGLTVANATPTVCGGTLTTTAPTGIALSGATIAANGQCQFSVTVTGAAAGSYTNTTGAVTSTNGGTGNTASASLTVATAPTITKAFGAASILLNSSTSLTVNINNPNATLALSGVAFSDSLPAGLVVATPNGLTSTCGGTVTAAAGSGSISLTGGALAANGSCTIALNVKGVAAGVQNNTTGPISSTESGAGATSNTASITVIGPPAIAKAFGAASINLNATTTLSFTITNPNATVALSGIAFGDTLPTGLAVANPNGLTGSCGSGTITTSAASITLSGGTIAAGGSCTFSVNVVGTTGGHKVNTTETVTSSNAGTGNQATATIDVNAPDLAITKTHVGQFTRGQTGAQYTITVSNVGFGPTTGTVTVLDTLPNVQNTLVPTAISGTGWTCTLATLTCTRADALTAGSYPAITLTVNVPINIKNSFTNTATVSGGGDVNPNNNTATDTVTLGPPILMTPQSSTVTVVHGNTGSMVINVAAPDPTLGKITFSCSGLPSRAACSFNPSSIDPAVTAGPTNVTLSIPTAKGTASLMAPTRPGSSHAPLYAMLAFPVFGVVLAGFGGVQRKKGTARWAALAMLGLMLLLAMAGCGVAPPPPPPTPGTPAGTSVVTITATSAGFTATTTFNLVVQ